MAVETEQSDQPIPEERVFATFRLYLTEDGTIAADVDYDGTKLAALDVNPLQGMICRHAVEHVVKDLQKTVDHVGEMTEVTEGLNEFFGLLGQLGLGETDDSEDNNSEGSDTERAASAGE